MSYIQRLEKLQHVINEKQLDLLFIDDPINLYYLTGLTLSAGRFCIPAEGEPLLFVDGRYFSQCKTNSPFPVALKEENALENYLSQPQFCIFGFDSTRSTYQEYLLLYYLLYKIHKIKEGEPNILVPIEDPLRELRGIKDEDEIGALRDAAALCSLGFDFAVSLLKEGISEKEIAIELEIFWKKRGGEKLAFDCIIAFGANSAMPHYRAGNAKLQKGQIVLIDIGVRYQRYFSDMTRTLFFDSAPSKLVEIYEIVKEAQERALEICHPGTLIGELDSEARTFITNKGYGPAFSHGLGHGVGLEIHEYPTLKNIEPFQSTPLQEGMVVTIEPGIYLPDIGGVRIENTIVITEEGYEDLTLRSRDLTIIPAKK